MMDSKQKYEPSALNQIQREEVFDFSIILINYNSSSYIERCFEHLQNQTFNGTIEIIVVNNLSTDNSLEILQSYSNISIIDAGCNLGYSKGNNLGISKSHGKYILCLNFDCFITEYFLQNIFNALETNPKVGMVSGKLYKIVNMKPTIYLDSTGIELSSLAPTDRGEWQYDMGQYDTSTQILGPSGAAATYRTKALADIVYNGIQVFDEQIFTYCEDIDLSWRLNLAGWQGLYVPSAVAYHERGATRKTNFFLKTGYYAIGRCNRYFIILKNIRYTDVKGNLIKLFVQELRRMLFFFGRHPFRWMVFIYVIFRLIRLLIQPSFFQKRQLAHRYQKGDHLNLETGKNFRETQRAKRNLKPMNENESLPNSSLFTKICINNKIWQISTRGINSLPWSKNNKYLSIFQRIKGSFLELYIPKKYQETIKNMTFFVDLDVGDNVTFKIEVASIDGKKHKSDYRVLDGGKGMYKINWGRMGILPGSDGIEIWQNKWAVVRLFFAAKIQFPIVIKDLFIVDENEKNLSI